MKVLSSIVFLISMFSVCITPFWIIVSYVNYLVKDQRFDYDSLYVFLFSFIAFFISALIFTIYRKEERRKGRVSKSKISPKMGSVFMKRLNEAERIMKEKLQQRQN